MGDHHGRSAGSATLLLRAVDGILGTHNQIITSKGATIASTVTYLLPVVAIVLGVLVLGESITAIVLAGVVLVLVGVALTRRYSHGDMNQTSTPTGGE